MYAVIENGGKQYRVELGAELELDQFDAEPGQTVDVGRVLLVADGDEALIGRPVVEGARVMVEVLRPMRGDKLIVFKYRPKARRRVKHGHRQDLTLVRVSDIEFAGRSAAREAEAVAEQEQRERAEAAKAAAAKAKADAALADKLAKDKAAEAKDEKAKADTKKTSAKADAKKSTAKAAAPKTTAKRSTSSKPAAVTPKKSSKPAAVSPKKSKPTARTAKKKDE